VFPKEQLSLVSSLTNEKISIVRGKKLTEGELIKFFGIVIWQLILSLQQDETCGHKQKKQSTKTLQHLAEQGCRGIDLTRSGQSLHFQSKRKKTSTMTWEEHRWMLIDDFINNFNNH
jgi:hypothetical protein